jgi:hypothetical protein
MFGGLVSYVINRIGGNNLKDVAGYQYENIACKISKTTKHILLDSLES